MSEQKDTMMLVDEPDWIVQIYTDRAKSLLKHAYRRLRNWEDAEDAVSALLVEMISRRDQLTLPDMSRPDFQKWMNNVLQSKVTDLIRKRFFNPKGERKRRSVSLSHGQHIEKSAPLLPHTFEMQEEALHIAKGVVKGEENLLILVELGDLEIAAVAAVLSLPESTVRERIRAMREALRDRYLLSDLMRSQRAWPGFSPWKVTQLLRGLSIHQGVVPLIWAQMAGRAGDGISRLKSVRAFRLHDCLFLVEQQAICLWNVSQCFTMDHCQSQAMNKLSEIITMIEQILNNIPFQDYSNFLTSHLNRLRALLQRVGAPLLPLEKRRQNLEFALREYDERKEIIQNLHNDISLLVPPKN